MGRLFVTLLQWDCKDRYIPALRPKTKEDSRNHGFCRRVLGRTLKSDPRPFTGLWRESNLT